MAAIMRKRINNRLYSFRLSDHLFKRVKDRGVQIRQITHALSKLNIIQLSDMVKEIGKEVAVVDYDEDITLFIGVKRSKLNCITILQGTTNALLAETKVIKVGG